MTGRRRPCRTPRTTYALVGTYTVSLAVTGPIGSDSLVSTDLVQTLPPPPVPVFSGGPISGVVPHTVSFTDLSSGGVTNWLWDFGDGGSTLTRSPTYTYTDPRHLPRFG